MPDTALIILESPWWDMDRNPGQVSVLPFFQGLERLTDNFKVYHSTFYDKKSFTEALTHFTDNDRYERYILYIAAHGSSLKVAKMHLTSLCGIVGALARRPKIEGVILGSCHVGSKIEHMKATIKDSEIIWMMGYKGAVDWLTSTLIDISVIESMLDINEYMISDREKIFNQFTDAIQRFNPTHIIAHDKEMNPMALLDTLSLVIQPRGQGYPPMDMTKELNNYKWILTDEDD